MSQTLLIKPNPEGTALKKMKCVSIKFTSILYAVMIEFLTSMYAFSVQHPPLFNYGTVLRNVCNHVLSKPLCTS